MAILGPGEVLSIARANSIAGGHGIESQARPEIETRVAQLGIPGILALCPSVSHTVRRSAHEATSA